MELNKWNWNKREYEPYVIPDGWNVKTYSNDMDEIVNCPHCGKKLSYGDTYTSREIHTQFGMGFGVCGECYEHEWARELKAKRARGEI